MIDFGGWKLPDGEAHLIAWMQNRNRIVDGRYGYQYEKLEAALAFVPKDKRRVAVDCGAHVGLWSFYLAKEFNVIHAFEPVEAHRECFELNMMELEGSKIALHHGALGDHAGEVTLHTGPASSGDTYIAKGGEHTSRMVTLDSMNLTGVDFIKIDVEGFEAAVIRGSKQTILDNRPVIVVEQKGHDAKYFGSPKHQALDLLREYGMTPLRPPISGDWIMGW